MNTNIFEGSDVTEIAPVNGVIHVSGIVRNAMQKISIRWEGKESNGVTECEAWRGQYEIDSLSKSGHKILGVSLA